MDGPGWRAGSRFGQYELRSLLGRGGMGEVYEAYDTVKDRVVAIKLLPEEYAKDPVYQVRFRRESQAAARLAEPHIIPIHDWGVIDGVLFIDMRLVPGVDLRSILRAHGPLGAERTLVIVDQIAAALDAAHAEGLVHRDVKPGNILVTDADFAYLADFGLAHTEGDAAVTQVGMAVGSYIYMAPERFDAGQVTGRADDYSLACVLHECLTGTTPFPATSMNLLIRAHLTEPPPRPSQRRPGIPVALDDVIARALAKDPAARYPSATAFAQAARAALSAAVPAAPTFVVRTPDPSRFGQTEQQAPASSIIPPESTGEMSIIPTAPTVVRPSEFQFTPLPKDEPESPVPIRPFPDAHLYGENQAAPAEATQQWSQSISGPYPPAASGPLAAVAAPTQRYGDAGPQPFAPTVQHYGDARPFASATQHYGDAQPQPASATPRYGDAMPEAQSPAPPTQRYGDAMPEPQPPAQRYGDANPVPLTQRYGEGIPEPQSSVPLTQRYGDEAQSPAPPTQRYGEPQQPTPQYGDQVAPDASMTQRFEPIAAPLDAYAANGYGDFQDGDYRDENYRDGGYGDGADGYAEETRRYDGGYQAPAAEPYPDASGYPVAQAYSDYQGGQAQAYAPDGYGYEQGGYEQGADYGYDRQGYDQQGYDQQAGDQQGGYEQEYGEAGYEQPERRRSALVPVLVTVAVILVLAVGGAVAWTVLRPVAQNAPIEEQAGPVATATTPRGAAPGGSAASSSATTSASTTSAALPAGAKSCSTGRAAPGSFAQSATGSEVTSCGFAEAVRQAYAESAAATSARGPRSVVAVSPVTGRSYTMNCVPAGQMVTCTGGENAVVYIY